MCVGGPGVRELQDQFTLTFICRVQLEVMLWTRESHTMATNWARTKADYEMECGNSAFYQSNSSHGWGQRRSATEGECWKHW